MTPRATTHWKGTVLCSLAFAMAFVAGTAAAQIANDPTRPAVGADAAASAAASGVALQSVVISRTLKAAIINGQMVKVGEKFGNARLVRVTESEAVLRDGSDVQVLKMYPGIEKKAVKPAATGTVKRTPAAPKAP